MGIRGAYSDLVPKILRNEEEDGYDGDEQLRQKEIEETTQETKAAHEKLINAAKGIPMKLSEPKYVKYESSKQSRIIKSVEKAADPLEPSKFKHKKLPRASGSPPVPVMHSPPRPLTFKDMQDWNAPPCISNWKNAKGYAIPLDKRLAADGRGLQDVEINQSFAKLSEALYVAEEKARETVAMRSKLQKEISIKEKERREQELRALARKARFERMEQDKDMVEEMTEERLQREEIREERHGERERKRRLTKRKIRGGGDRDISEKIALGMGYSEARRGLEVIYDERLFNQTNGLDSGFGSDDQYNVFDKKLSNVQSMLSTLYRPTKDHEEEEANPDPFELDQFMKKVKKSEQIALATREA